VPSSVSVREEFGEPKAVEEPMPDDTHPLKQALIDLAEWHDRWRDEPGLELLVEAARREWIGYVAANCGPSRDEVTFAEVILLRPRKE
jgi:hypothetical protein